MSSSPSPLRDRLLRRTAWEHTTVCASFFDLFDWEIFSSQHSATLVSANCLFSYFVHFSGKLFCFRNMLKQVKLVEINRAAHKTGLVTQMQQESSAGRKWKENNADSRRACWDWEWHKQRVKVTGVTCKGWRCPRIGSHWDVGRVEARWAAPPLLHLLSRT